MSEKIRLDAWLFENKFFDSRSKAAAIIMEGLVYVNGIKVNKAGYFVKSDDIVYVKSEKIPYVSRGGLKLEKALEVFPIDLNGRVCVDIGASTGGFTDCMLQNGAKKVFSVDVGYGQLAWKLRSNPSVVVMERTNFRYVNPESFSEIINFVACDVSFISLKIILPVVYEVLSENGLGVFLIKPQFEAGREKVGKKGVVRDISVHLEIVENIVKFASETGFSVEGLSFSPIKGPQGNIEYLLFIKKCFNQNMLESDKIKKIVENSHKELDIK
ncbi:MAG: TlyA family RNA methyltransferase [Candidatus Fimenecus sp.]